MRQVGLGQPGARGCGASGTPGTPGPGGGRRPVGVPGGPGAGAEGRGVGSVFSPVPTPPPPFRGSELLFAPWREPDTESAAEQGQGNPPGLRRLCATFFSSRNPNSSCFLTFHGGTLLVCKLHRLSHISVTAGAGWCHIGADAGERLGCSETSKVKGDLGSGKVVRRQSA